MFHRKVALFGPASHGLIWMRMPPRERARGTEIPAESSRSPLGVRKEPRSIEGCVQLDGVLSNIVSLNAPGVFVLPGFRDLFESLDQVWIN